VVGDRQAGWHDLPSFFSFSFLRFLSVFFGRVGGGRELDGVYGLVSEIFFSIIWDLRQDGVELFKPQCLPECGSGMI